MAQHNEKTAFNIGKALRDAGSLAKGTVAGYPHQLNKFYNPYSQAWNEPATDNIERGLQYAGRAAMGVGAGAAGLAGGIAAAPALAGAASAGTAAVESGLAAAGAQLPQIASAAAKVVTPARALTAILGGGAVDSAAKRFGLGWRAPTPEQAAAVVQNTKDQIYELNRRTGESVVRWGGLGLAGAGGATALYYLMHRRRKQQEEKRRREQAAALNSGDLKFAADGLSDYLANGLSRTHAAIGSAFNTIAGIGDDASAAGPYRLPGGIMGGGTLIAMPLIAGTAGILGAHHFVNAREKKRDAEAADAAVIEAKKDYMRALSGDKAASLDAAYEKFAAHSKTALEPGFVPPPVPEPQLRGYVDYPESLLQKLYAGALVSGAAGLGLGAHYMYNKTKKNLAANNLAAAAETRARLRALPAPWIDPAELAGLQHQLREAKS